MLINTFFIIIIFISMKSTTHQVSTSPGIPPVLPYQLFVWGCFFFTSTASFASHIATAGQFQENLIYSAPPGEYRTEYLNHDKVSSHQIGRREHS